MYSVVKTCGVCIAIMAVSQQAHAGLVINITEDSGNVEAEFSGTMDLLALSAGVGVVNAYNGHLASIGAFGNGGSVDTYGGDVAAWTPFGTGAFANWDSVFGDSIALFTDVPVILGLNEGYVSGALTSGGATSFGTDFATLGFDIGSYTTTLTNSATGVSDTVTINVGVPAPSAIALLGFAGVFGAKRRRSA